MIQVKRALLFAIASFVTLVALAPAFAFTDPHVGAYGADTDLCGQCHRTHTAIDTHLNTAFFDMNRCFSCHDGTGSTHKTTDQFIPKAYRHSLAGMDAGATTQCSNCHETHKVADISSQLLVNPLNTRDLWTIVSTPTESGYDDSSTTSGIYRWCEGCHKTPLGTIGSVLVQNTMAASYVPYPVNIVWRTSKDPLSGGVDDSGTTTGYWGYFNADAYNTLDNTATGEYHGRLSSETTTTTFYGPYKAAYPALPCTACHDSHGSNQPWLIKDSISVGDTTTAGYDMKTEVGQRKFCTSCHDRGKDMRPGKCTDCHRHGKGF